MGAVWDCTAQLGAQQTFGFMMWLCDQLSYLLLLLDALKPPAYQSP